MTIKAIETEYAGHRFRSRLEARWAVCFDVAGVRWEYEPQGFELIPRITGWLDKDPQVIRYLPDFWLPDFQLWAEVKGALTGSELVRLCDVSAALSSPEMGCASSRDKPMDSDFDQGRDMLVLGPGFASNSAPHRLHMHKGTLHLSVFDDYAARTPWRCAAGEPIADDCGDVHQGASVLPASALGYVSPFAAGYGAARRARFEYGARATG